MRRESYRKPYEFDRDTKIEAYRRAEYQCEVCGSTDGLQCHHILGIWYATKHHPEISAVVIKSLANLKILCSSCHDDAHSGTDEEWLAMDEQAQYLLTLQTMSMFEYLENNT